MARRHVLELVAILSVCAGAVAVAKWRHAEESPRSPDVRPTSGHSAGLRAFVTTSRRQAQQSKAQPPVALAAEPRPAPAELSPRDLQRRTERVRLVYEAMDRLIAARAAERVNPATPDPPLGSPQSGSLAAARAWLGQLPQELWNAVAEETDLPRSMIEEEWKARPRGELRTAAYGTGTFIVCKRVAISTPAPKPETGRIREATIEPASGLVEKPWTEDEWYDTAETVDRAAFLTALFVESSGLFDILTISEAQCAACDGAGCVEWIDRDGQTLSRLCQSCNAAGKTRAVLYR